MKFEKLSENKLRITITNKELAEKNIDFHTFMSNSIETQNLFVDILEQAEKKVGFVTKNYKIKVEALAMDGGEFIVTVTRFSLNNEKNNINQSHKSRKIMVRRKTRERAKPSELLIYCFKTFDDFCLLCDRISKEKNFTTIAKNIVLYVYNKKYYLVMSETGKNIIYVRKFSNIITEFGIYVHNADSFLYKLHEKGNIILKHNALKKGIKYFVK